MNWLHVQIELASFHLPWRNLLMLLLMASAICVGQTSSQTTTQPPTIETVYDSAKDRTTVRLAKLRIGGDVGKYRSIYLSPYFSFPGRNRITPEIVDFEVQTVIKGRLRTDLYVLFLIDGENVFLSSSRWAVPRPVPGRVWVGERLVFRMPYATFLKLTKAKTFALSFDGVSFAVGENELQALRELLSYMKPL